MEEFQQERRQHMDLLSEKILTLHADVNEVKTSIKDLTTAINKLAVVEERLAHSNKLLDRLFTQQQKTDERIEALEKKSVSSDNSAKWIDRTIVGLLGAFLVFIWERVIK
jgi:chromosome segregation ATPase